jgi:DNA-binding NtrC family response regulator
VRELENVVEHMVVLLEPDAEISPDHIPALSDPAVEEPASWRPPEVTIEEPYYAARDRLVAEFELHYLTQLVTYTRGNMSRAARAARVDRTTLYRLMERHGLHRKLLAASALDGPPEPDEE